MDSKTILRIAREALTTARFLAPYQNAFNVRLVPKSAFRRLFWFLFPPRPADLKESQVTDIVNALINSGNVLEMLVRDKLREERNGKPESAAAADASSAGGT